MVALRRVLSQIRQGTRASLAHDLAAAPRPVRTVRIRLAPTPDAPERARRAVDCLVVAIDNPRFAFFLRLLASELVTNAVAHGSTRSTISMTARLFDDAAELEIMNGGGRLSLRRMRTHRPGGGRGLDIVDELVDTWAIDAGSAGTKVSVRLSADRTDDRKPSGVSDRRPNG
jgi:hypothetical protein